MVSWMQLFFVGRTVAAFESMKTWLDISAPNQSARVTAARNPSLSERVRCALLLKRTHTGSFLAALLTFTRCVGEYSMFVGLVPLYIPLSRLKLSTLKLLLNCSKV
jgi:hypothetical protein